MAIVIFNNDLIYNENESVGDPYRMVILLGVGLLMIMQLCAIFVMQARWIRDESVPRLVMAMATLGIGLMMVVAFSWHKVVTSDAYWEKLEGAGLPPTPTVQRRGQTVTSVLWVMSETGWMGTLVGLALTAVMLPDFVTSWIFLAVQLFMFTVFTAVFCTVTEDFGFFLALPRLLVFMLKSFSSLRGHLFLRCIFSCSTDFRR